MTIDTISLQTSFTPLQKCSNDLVNHPITPKGFLIDPLVKIILSTGEATDTLYPQVRLATIQLENIDQSSRANYKLARHTLDITRTISRNLVTISLSCPTIAQTLTDDKLDKLIAIEHSLEHILENGRVTQHNEAKPGVPVFSAQHGRDVMRAVFCREVVVEEEEPLQRADLETCDSGMLDLLDLVEEIELVVERVVKRLRVVCETYKNDLGVDFGLLSED